MGCCVNNLHGICASYWDHKETDSSADLELYIKHSRVGENKGIQATSNTLNRKWRVSAIAARCFFFPLSGSHTHTHWGQRWRKAHAAGSSTGVSYSGIHFHFIEHGFIRIKKKSSLMALVLSLQAIHIHPLLRECQEHSSTRMDCHGRRRCGSTERRGRRKMFLLCIFSSWTLSLWCWT